MTKRRYERTDTAGRRDEFWLTAAGIAGLTLTGFVACGGNDSSAGTGGSAGTAGSVAAGATGGSGGTAAGTTNGGTGGTSGSAGAEGGTGTTVACSADSSTAANMEAVVAAATELVSKLTADQQSTIQLDATIDNVEQWSNLPTSAIARNGVMLGDMSADAQTAAVALVAVAAGDTGSTLFSELRAADEYLVTNGNADSNSYGEGRYYIAFVGVPSTTSSWTLQVAGHHLAYNFTYNGACTSATPLFDGVEPTTWTDTTDHAPLETQRAAAVAVIAAIAGDPTSLLSGTYSDIVNGPTNANGKGDSHYPSGLTYPTGTSGRGVLVGSLSTDDQQLVKTAIEAWVHNVADPIANALLAEYESDDALAATYVAYSGATDLTTKNSYFRVDGPRVWIEYTIQGGIVYPSRVHYHTIWRDKAADYGAEYVDAEPSTDTSTAGTSSGGPGSGGPPGGSPPGAAAGGAPAGL
jgi:Protein of unknown function (DUF3500)